MISVTLPVFPLKASWTDSKAIAHVCNYAERLARIALVNAPNTGLALSFPGVSPRYSSLNTRN
jgi:hypothetical protein